MNIYEHIKNKYFYIIISFSIIIFIQIFSIGKSYAEADLLLTRSRINVIASPYMAKLYDSNKITFSEAYAIHQNLPNDRSVKVVWDGKIWISNGNQPLPIFSVWNAGLPDQWIYTNWSVAYPQNSEGWNAWKNIKSLRDFQIYRPYNYARAYQAALRLVASNGLVKAPKYNPITFQWDYVPKRPRILFSLAGVNPENLKFVAENFDILTKDLYESKSVYRSRMSRIGVVTEWELLTVLMNPAVLQQTDFIIYVMKVPTKGSMFGIEFAKDFGIDLTKDNNPSSGNFVQLPGFKGLQEYFIKFGVVDLMQNISTVQSSILGNLMFEKLFEYKAIDQKVKTGILSPDQAKLPKDSIERGSSALRFQIQTADNIKMRSKL